MDALRAHLIDELHIPEAQIKVATGTQRELDGLDLAARSSPVRFIITVQALREGWDCPFAYVLCSVQSIRSATAVEQLLGRVLRMPYATTRTRPALNKAYAHVTEEQTGMAANALADRLIDGMGFDPLDMASMVAPMLPLDLPHDDGPLFAASQPPIPSLTLDLPAGKPLPEAAAQAVATGEATVSTDGNRQRLRVVGAVGEALAEQLIAAHKGKQRAQTAEQIERHNALVAAATAPVNRGERFAPLPRLAYRIGAQGELALLEREAVFEQVELNLLADPVALAGFAMVEQDAIWQVYLDGNRMRVGSVTGEQLGLAGVRGTATEDDLARWLATALQHPARNVAQDVTPSHLRAFIIATLHHLTSEQRVPLEQLVRHQHALAQRLEARIAELRDRAAHAAFRQCVLDESWHIEASAAHRFEFGPAYPVPANKRYEGKFRFAKHYYPVLADLKDGGEEWHCAIAVEHHPQVARWVRNLDSDPVAAFWLPTSFGRFYPDFVCELKDGRLLVVEYKGAQIASMPKEIEKGEVGKLWAERSNGRCLFAMVFKEFGGLGVAQQLDAAITDPR